MSIVISANLCNCQNNGARIYAYYPPIQNSASIKVLNQPPTTPYITVADFDCVNMTIGSVKAKAAKLGADAVYIASFDGSVFAGNTDLNNTNRSHGINTHLYCTAIKYK